ncbi:ribonuclease P protein component [Roseomonas sp. CCTCC AB2023176]|uniref:ribonuclease P protein component n=1 Tax=Roseomonas sp. CCTCC AB2023176 TaxID=3342640 RepID=UPI0035DA03F8
MALPRIKQRRDFLRAARTGKRAARPGLILQAQPVPAAGPDAAPLRVGFTVTKKVGNAVVRNRTKRRLREAARFVLGEAPPELLRNGGWDLVLIGRDDTRKRDFRTLMGDLRGCLKQTGVLP